MSSNNNNFTINTDQDTVTIQPKSQAKVNVIFNPSSIGNGNEQQHQSKISFINDKVCIQEKNEVFHFYIFQCTYNRFNQIILLYRIQKK
jgi:hypothetical protein